jgi:hypothetical protein
MGIRDRPISPRSPWQNPYVERLIGTVRGECLDRVLVFGEAHLRQILSSYAVYYNGVRPHLALGKDAPLGRAVQRSGDIVAIPILSGPHHHIFGKDRPLAPAWSARAAASVAPTCGRTGRRTRTAARLLPPSTRRPPRPAMTRPAPAETLDELPAFHMLMLVTALMPRSIRWTRRS